MKELRCYVRVDAPSRSCRDSCGRLSTDIELQIFIFGQAGDFGDISSLLVTKRPRIAVGESGGQPTSQMNVHGLIPWQWGESFGGRVHSRRHQELHHLTPSQRDSSCLQPVPRHYKDSIALTGLHPTFTTNSATCFMGGIIADVCQTFKPMTWCGLLIIWIRYVTALPFHILRFS